MPKNDNRYLHSTNNLNDVSDLKLYDRDKRMKEHQIALLEMLESQACEMAYRYGLGIVTFIDSKKLRVVKQYHPFCLQTMQDCDNYDALVSTVATYNNFIK